MQTAIRRHLDNEKRLNQVLDGNLYVIEKDFRNILKKYSLDKTPEIAADVLTYTLEELFFENVNHHMSE